MNPKAFLSYTGDHPVTVLLVAIGAYAALALGSSLAQWTYASRFRRDWVRAELRGRRKELEDRRRGRPPSLAAVDVIVPCYNERPEALEACCEALERQRDHYDGPLHVWLVDDGSQVTGGLEPIYRRYEARPGWTVIRHARNRGKRRAQDSAFRRCRGDYMVTVDSDTTLAPTCIARLADAMDRHPHAGAISGHVTAANAWINRLTALIDQRYQFLFRQERAAQSWHSTVTCCSGPVSIYRCTVLAKIWTSYVEDRFLGRQRQFGDDLKLTLLIIEQTYDSLYWPTAKAWTNVPDTLRGYARQQVRWNKSFYRELRRADHALRAHLRSPCYLELRRPRYLGRRRARYLGWAGAHRYVRFELVARALVPLLPVALLPASVWVAIRGHGGVPWLPLLAMVATMSLQAVVVGLQSRSWTFPLLYGPLHLAMLNLVRLRALATLTDSRWGTRGDADAELGPGEAHTAATVRPAPASCAAQAAAERAGSS